MSLVVSVCRLDIWIKNPCHVAAPPGRPRLLCMANESGFTDSRQITDINLKFVLKLLALYI